MKPRQLEEGKRFFSLLNRNSDLLMQAYLSGEVDEAMLDVKQSEDLLKAGAIWRPAPDRPLLLSSPLRNLLEEALSDLRNRDIDANVGSRLTSLKTLAAHYIEARHQGDLASADAYLSDLSDHTYSLTESLRHSTRVLWSRINNEFGYVVSLSAKIRENELAQQQVSELLDSLHLLSFDTLSNIAGDVRELRRLLTVHLVQTVHDCSQELAVVQGRLLTLLGRFRELRGRSRLLKGFLLYSEQHPDYLPQDPSAQVEVSSLFNQAPSLLQGAALDLHMQEHESSLLDLASKLQLRRNTVSDEPQAASSVQLEDIADYQITEQQIKQDVEAYLVHSLEQADGLSALSYLQQQALEWDSEMWLYQVWSSYHGLPEEQRSYFKLDPVAQADATFSGNSIVSDMVVWFG